jgi:hypothetical protein
MAISLELRNRSNPTQMLTQILLGLSFTLFLISCNSHPGTKTGKDSLTNDPAIILPKIRTTGLVNI